jgi:hypothetical protein
MKPPLSFIIHPLESSCLLTSNVGQLPVVNLISNLCGRLGARYVSAVNGLQMMLTAEAQRNAEITQRKPLNWHYPNFRRACDESQK